MNDLFYFKEKNQVFLSRYADFPVFDESTDFKIYDVIVNIIAH